MYPIRKPDNSVVRIHRDDASGERHLGQKAAPVPRETLGAGYRLPSSLWDPFWRLSSRLRRDGTVRRSSPPYVLLHPLAVNWLPDARITKGVADEIELAFRHGDVR